MVFSARRSPPGIEIVTVRSGGGAPASAATSISRRADHSARGRVDRRLADREREPGAGNRADTLACGKAEPPARSGPRGFGDDQCAMGDIGIIPRILDDTRRGRGLRRVRRAPEEKLATPPRGSRIDNRVGETVGQHRGECRTGRRRRAGAGSQPRRKRCRRLACHNPILAKPGADDYLLAFLWYAHGSGSIPLFIAKRCSLRPLGGGDGGEPSRQRRGG